MILCTYLSATLCWSVHTRMCVCVCVCVLYVCVCVCVCVYSMYVCICVWCMHRGMRWSGLVLQPVDPLPAMMPVRMCHTVVERAGQGSLDRQTIFIVSRVGRTKGSWHYIEVNIYNNLAWSDQCMQVHGVEHIFRHIVHNWSSADRRLLHVPI